MIERHPAGRSCALVLLVAGVLTASALTGLFALSASGGPAVPANAPAAVVVTLAPTTAPAVTTTAAATTTAPATTTTTRAPVPVPRAAEETTVANQPTTDPEYVDLGSGVIQRVAPDPNSDPSKNVAPTLNPQSGLDPEGNPVG